MENNSFPITPSPELVQQWLGTYFGAMVTGEVSDVELELALATQAARWGADQELEACIEVILSYPGFESPELFVEVLRASRRPKPPSLKEQALMLLEPIGRPHAEPDAWKSLRPEEVDIIRRALESLPD